MSFTPERSAVTPVDEIENVRSIPLLAPFRQHRHLVIVCGEGAARYTPARREFAAMNAELVIEESAGPLSSALGTPSVTVADRYGSIGFRAPRAPVERILRELEGFELACPECGPQAWGDPGR